MTAPIVLSGRGRMLVPSGPPGPARATIDDAGFTLSVNDGTRVVAFRDLDTIAVQERATLLVLGSGEGAERVLLDQFGSDQGQLVRELRDRRLRQRAADALVTLPQDEPIDLVEYDDGSRPGVGQLAYHAWGAILVPLDERLPPLRIRRSRIAAVRPNDTGGAVEVELSSAAGGSTTGLRLVRLGAAARIHADRFEALRAGARIDAARIVATLIADAPYPARQEAARILVDGRPARPADLPASWTAIEAGVLVDPTFATSYHALRDRAGGQAPSRAIAVAPVEPGGDGSRSWFLVPLPGNLLSLELVSEGAHATYCFRIVPRAEFVADPSDPAAIDAAIGAISEALVDGRFLREPMALTDAALAEPKAQRYRFALAAIPSLAAARDRFVARIVHRDDASWAAALDDLIVWHGSTRDDGAVWPGRAAEDELVDDAPAEVVGGTPAGAPVITSGRSQGDN